MNDLSRILIQGHETLKTALERLNHSGRTVILLIDQKGRLKRTITDGDLRRLILEGEHLDSTLSLLPEQIAWTVPEGTGPEAVLALMNRHGIDQLPVLDGEGRPVDLHLRRELDQPILLSTPHLSEHERDFVEQAFATNWIAPLGPNVDAFESELAQAVNVPHAAALSSGTAAIHLGLHLLGVVPGDVVFCSALTFVATANPIRYLGAKPVFIDSEPGTWNMCPDALQRALAHADVEGRLPRVVMPVGLYGQSPEMEPIIDLCSRYDIPILEDAAESLGASYGYRHAGTMGRLGVYSFNGNKIITTSGGGMLVGHDSELIERARFLSTQAREPAPHYQHSELGFNYRMSNILAGVGRGQLKVLKERVNQRRSVFERYTLGLDDIEGLEWMPEAPGHRSTRWLSAACIDPATTGVSPSELISALSQSNIEARHVWKPLHRQPLFEGAPYWPHHSTQSVSDELFERGICLPSGSNLSHEAQRRVIDRIQEIMHNASARTFTSIPQSQAS